MPPTQKISMVLTMENLAFLQSRVGAGEYASLDEATNDAVGLVREQAADFQRWLQDVAGPAYDRIASGDDTGVPSEDVMNQLKAERLERKTT